MACFKFQRGKKTMTNTDEGNQPRVVKEAPRVQDIQEIATAVSTQAQVANRMWIGLVSVAAIAVLPPVSDKTGEVPLPFGLGPVDAAEFYVIVFFMLVVLTIAFSAAHAQQLRAQKQAHSFINRMRTGTLLAGMDPRDLFDMLRVPSLNRVSPLAQALKGKYQFYGEAAHCPILRRFGSVVYYGLLKIISMPVYYGLPAFALWHTYGRAHAAIGSGWWGPILCFGGVLASATYCKYSLAICGPPDAGPHIWSGAVR